MFSDKMVAPFEKRKTNESKVRANRILLTLLHYCHALQVFNIKAIIRFIISQPIILSCPFSVSVVYKRVYPDYYM